MPRYCIREDVVMYGTAYYYVCAADEDEAREEYRRGNADYSDTDWGDTDSTGEYDVEEESDGCDGCDRENTEDCPDYEEDEENEDEDGRKCADCVHFTGSDRCPKGYHTIHGTWASRCSKYEEAEDDDKPRCNKCQWRNDDDRECNAGTSWVQDETMTKDDPDEGWAAKCTDYEKGDPKTDEDLGVCATCRHHGDHECLYPKKVTCWQYPCPHGCGMYEAKAGAPKPTPKPPVEEDPLAFLD